MAENLSGSDPPPPPPPPDPPEHVQSGRVESDSRLEGTDPPERRASPEGSIQHGDTTVPQPRLPEETPELQAQAMDQELGAETAPQQQDSPQAPGKASEQTELGDSSAKAEPVDHSLMEDVTSENGQPVGVDESPSARAQTESDPAGAAENHPIEAATDTPGDDNARSARNPEESTELQDVASQQEIESSVPDDAADPTSTTVADQPARADPELSGWQDPDGQQVATEYASVADRELVKQPTIDTASQGQIGDCSLIASIGAVSNVDPGHWENHIRDDNDSAGVTLYRDGVPTEVMVEKSVPVSASGREVGATTTDGSSFAPLVEKAYVQEFTQNDYAVLDQGVWPHDTLSSLTGREGQHDTPAARGPEGVRQLVNDGIPVVGASRPTGDLSPEGKAERGRGADQIPVVSSHAYTVRDIADDGSVQLNNPWGFDHLNLTWEQFDRQFDYLGWS